MAEGDEHTNLSKSQSLVLMGIDRKTLHVAGIPPKLIDRIYKALW